MSDLKDLKPLDEMILKHMCGTTGVLYHLSGIRFEKDTRFHRYYRWFMILCLLYSIITNICVDLYMKKFHNTMIVALSFRMYYMHALLAVFILQKSISGLIINNHYFEIVTRLDIKYFCSRMDKSVRFAYWTVIMTISMFIMLDIELAVKLCSSPISTAKIKEGLIIIVDVYSLIIFAMS